MFLDLYTFLHKRSFQEAVTFRILLMNPLAFHKFQQINYVFIKYNIKKIKITTKFAGKIEEK
jgi:hypothetical protein